jgi:hypothetical protein
MFKIDRTMRGDRLDADAVLTPSDFESIAKELDRPPLRVRKVGYVAARRAKASEMVETHWNGKETTNTARVGDFIVTNLSPDREPLRDKDGHMNFYVFVSERFSELYEATAETSEHGAIYRAKCIVSALPLPGGFDILAPWGERQTAAKGYLLLNGQEVYGSSAEAFEVTYEVANEAWPRALA